MKSFADFLNESVDIDSLPQGTKEDIAHNLAERHPYFKEHGYSNEDVHNNLFGLAHSPKVSITKAHVATLHKTMHRKNSSAAVNKYANHLKENPKHEYDPILTNHGKFLDGGHRLEAYKKAGRTHIPTVDIGHMMNASHQHWHDWFEGSTDQKNPIYGNHLK